jgi:hypothetical protein
VCVVETKRESRAMARGTIDDQRSRKATIDCSRAQRTDGERSGQLGGARHGGHYDGDESEPENSVMS